MADDVATTESVPPKIPNVGLAWQSRRRTEADTTDQVSTIPPLKFPSHNTIFNTAINLRYDLAL
eukprot:scaffold10085_cov168-Amphora_coffeaeformis.AAC.8